MSYSARFTNLTNKQFGDWLVLNITEMKHGHRAWLCRCLICNKEYIVVGSELTTGRSKSCRPCSAAKTGKNNTTHGMSNTTDYNTWYAIKGRCLNVNDNAYKNYGGRGITIYNWWKICFYNFWNDILKEIGPRPSSKYELDRINNDGNYEPGNVRWATWKEQARNRRNNRFLEYQGQKWIMSDLAEKFNLSTALLCWRLKRGWTIERALIKPNKRSKTPLTSQVSNS